MTGAPPLPDLAKLTSEQKDQLIVSLWRTVQALDGAQEPLADTASAQPAISRLQARIGVTAASRRASTPRRRGLARGRLLPIVLLLVGAGFLSDFAVGRYQERALAARNRAALALENAAFNGLDAELLRVVYVPDGTSYRAIMTMHNTYPTPLYVMVNPVRVFVQVGQNWQEQPVQATVSSVVELIGDYEYQAPFRVDAKDWRELIPGYMHVRIDSDMLISQRTEPGGDIIQRNNRFYAYLKPQNADDAAIKRRSNFPGVPPVFILMPPH